MIGFSIKTVHLCLITSRLSLKCDAFGVATITPSICKKFADRNNHEIPDEFFGSKYAYEWDDFYDFLKKYDIVTSVIHTPEDYYELTYEYLKECAANNVIYLSLIHI